jgi:hypothetical protein
MLNLEMEELLKKYEKLLKVHERLSEETKKERKELASVKEMLNE